MEEKYDPLRETIPVEEVGQIHPRDDDDSNTERIKKIMSDLSVQQASGGLSLGSDLLPYRSTGGSYRSYRPMRRRYRKRRRMTKPKRLTAKTIDSMYKRRATADAKKVAYLKGLAEGKYGPRGTLSSLRTFGIDDRLADEQQKLNRQQYGFYGKGDYWAKWIPRGIGALVGGVGASWSQPANLNAVIQGASAGWDAGANFSKLLGWGDYGTEGNMLASGGVVPVNPDNKNGGISISHCEFVGNIVASGSAGAATAFELRKYVLNPGDPSVFPFLSQLAANFVMYEWEGLIFQFRPTSGDAPTSLGLGKIVMSTEYDPDAADFPNSMVMANNSLAQTCKPTQMALHGIETHPAHMIQPIMYVRSGSSAAGKPRNMLDLGNFYLATEGIPMPTGQTSQIIGELWVAYKCRFMRPNLAATYLAETNNYDYMTTSHSATQSISGVVYKSTNSIGTVVAGATNASRTITWPARSYGLFDVLINLSTTTAGFSWSSTTVSAGCTTYNANNVASATGYTLTQATNKFFWIRVLIPPTVTATNPVLTIPHTALTDAGTTDFIQVTEVALSMIQ